LWLLLISTSTRPIFAKFAGLAKATPVDDQSEIRVFFDPHVAVAEFSVLSILSTELSSGDIRWMALAYGDSLDSGGQWLSRAGYGLCHYKKCTYA